LAGFRGTLVCDGYKVYPNAGARLGFKTAGCLAHIRRKFILAEEAATKQKKAQRTRATEALQMIDQIYDIEREAKDLPPDKRLAIRQQQAQRIFDHLFEWLTKMKNVILPTSLIGKAISYALGQWDRMGEFLLNPEVSVGRVKMWRGELMSDSTALLTSVSTSCSSNRTCAANASGFRPKGSTFSRLPLQPWSLAA